jgi:outer membrane scaffolding protein for murein synthesis (MipA/OmpV family)
MMKIITLRALATVLACAFAASHAMAYDEVSSGIAANAGGFLGLGATYRPDYEGSDNYEAKISAFGRYNMESGRYISLGGTSGSERAARLKMNILTRETPWEVGPVLQYRFKRGGDVENNKVSNMQSVPNEQEAGGFVGYHAGDLFLSMTGVYDIAGESDGTLFYFNGLYRLPVNDHFEMGIGAHTTWASNNYMETYFGVSGPNATNSGLPKYNAGSGLKDAGVGLTGHYKFTKTWGMIGNVSYTRMLNDAEDSPLVKKVGDENQYTAIVALTYNF